MTASWKRADGRSLARLGVVGLVLAFTHPAHAQDTASAEILFDEGRKLLAEGKLGEACPKLAESQRLAPAVGTLLNLGICYEKSGLTASAWTAFKEAVSLARATGQSEREQLARSRVQQVEGQVSTLTILVAPPTSNVPGLVVRRDGLVLSPAAWGSPIPVDPGTHRIEVSAPSKVTWTVPVDVAASAAKVRIDVPTLVDAPVTREAHDVDKPAVVSVVAVTPTASGSSTQRTVGLVVAGLGIGSVAVGSVFGLVAKSNNDAALGHCGGGTICDAEGVALTQDAQSAATVSTIAFGVGGAAVLTGVILFFTAPKKTSPPSIARWRAAPALGPSSAALLMGGAW